MSKRKSLREQHRTISTLPLSNQYVPHSSKLSSIPSQQQQGKNKSKKKKKKKNNTDNNHNNNNNNNNNANTNSPVVGLGGRTVLAPSRMMGVHCTHPFVGWFCLAGKVARGKTPKNSGREKSKFAG